MKTRFFIPQIYFDIAKLKRCLQKHVDSLSANNESRLDISRVFNHQVKEFDSIISTNLDSITLIKIHL